MTSSYILNGSTTWVSFTDILLKYSCKNLLYLVLFSMDSVYIFSFPSSMKSNDPICKIVFSFSTSLYPLMIVYVPYLDLRSQIEICLGFFRYDYIISNT